MLIQCQSCTHKFRLNLERLPARKTFVRCKNCGTPIYIHGEEEGPEPASALPETVMVPEHLADSPVIPPWLAGLPPEDAGDAVLVTCPQCESHYRMPREPLQRQGIKLKCTQCGHVFPPPPELAGAAGSGAVSGVDGAADGGRRIERRDYDLRPAESRVIAPEDVIPEPDEQRMSGLFDDMTPDPGIRRPASHEPPAEPDAEEAYLAAIDLGEDIPRPGKGTVPDDQKYGLFLKAGELTAREPEPPAAPPPEPPAPEPPPLAAEPVEAVEATFEDELPPLDEVAAPAAPGKPAAPKPTPPKPEPAQAARVKEEMPVLPALVTEPPHRPPPNKKVVPDQERWLTPKQRYIVLGAAAAVVLLITGMWAVWLYNSPSGSRPYAIETGRVHQLAMENELEGRYVANRPSGERLFVVQGSVENHFPRDTQISWIRLRGVAYTDREQTKTLGTAFGFIGNVLTDKQLGSWELDAIQAYAGYNNGRDNANYRIPPGGRVPFQLVFVGITAPVGRTVAQVVSYHRNNLTVYVDTGR